QTVLIIDWSLNGRGIAADLSVSSRPGFCEVLQGTATFSNVVQLVPKTRIQIIPSGAAYAQGGDGLDPDQLNLILDALDEAYDQILIVAERPQAAILFEAIQGRIDAGVSVINSLDDVELVSNHEGQDRRGHFLGFETTDIELVNYVDASTLGAGSPPSLAGAAGLSSSAVQLKSVSVG
ncbi:MAG: hypothetical protein AAFO75_10260, partial [Pseudomonadota bacterium]